jgi:hypothetical protein
MMDEEILFSLVWDDETYAFVCKPFSDLPGEPVFPRHGFCGKSKQLCPTMSSAAYVSQTLQCMGRV